jgi:hypothetical protein
LTNQPLADSLKPPNERMREKLKGFGIERVDDHYGIIGAFGLLIVISVNI